MIWKRANARGAIAGLVAGFTIWVYTLLLPMFAQSGLFSTDFMIDGPLGVVFLKPQALFGTDLPPLLHGVFWSLLFNIIGYTAGSVSRGPELIERLQANVFVPDELRPLTGASPVAHHADSGRSRRHGGAVSRSRTHPAVPSALMPSSAT